MNSMGRGNDISFLEGSRNKTIFMTAVALARKTRARLMAQCSSGQGSTPSSVAGGSAVSGY